MIRTVVEHDAEIDHRKSGEVSARRRILDSFFDGRNEVLRNRAAENVVHEFELSAARQRLHLDLAIAVLAVPAGLFLVASLHVGFAANRLPIRNLGRFQIHFGVIALLQLRDDDFDVLLAGARDQKLLGLRIAEEAQHGILFHELVQAGTKLVFVGAGLGLDCERDRRLGQLHARILNRRRLVAERVAGQSVFQLGDGADVAGMQFGHRNCGLPLHA